MFIFFEELFFRMSEVREPVFASSPDLGRRQLKREPDQTQNAEEEDGAPPHKKPNTRRLFRILRTQRQKSNTSTNAPTKPWKCSTNSENRLVHRRCVKSFAAILRRVRNEWSGNLRFQHDAK